MGWWSSGRIATAILKRKSSEEDGPPRPRSVLLSYSNENVVLAQEEVVQKRPVGLLLQQLLGLGLGMSL